MSLTKAERAALSLAVCHYKAIMPAGHRLLNANIKALLSVGYVTYGRGDKAYRLTSKGKIALYETP